MELKGVEGGDRKRGLGGEKHRAKSLRIGVHHANAVVWEPVYRTHLRDELRELEDRPAFLLRPRHGGRRVDFRDRDRRGDGDDDGRRGGGGDDADQTTGAVVDVTGLDVSVRGARLFEDAELRLMPGRKVRSIHWSPYDRVGVVNADP